MRFGSPPDVRGVVAVIVIVVVLVVTLSRGFVTAVQF